MNGTQKKELGKEKNKNPSRGSKIFSGENYTSQSFSPESV